MVKMQSSSQQSNSHLAFSWNNPPRTAAKKNTNSWASGPEATFTTDITCHLLSLKITKTLIFVLELFDGWRDKLVLCDPGPFSRQLQALQWHFPLLLFLGFPNWEESLTFRQSASYSASPSNCPQVLKLLHRSSTTCSIAGSTSPKLFHNVKMFSITRRRLSREQLGGSNKDDRGAEGLL